VARYLARWWLSDLGREAHLEVDWSHEYADLPRCHRQAERWDAHCCDDRAAPLLIVDLANPGEALHVVSSFPGPVVLTLAPMTCVGVAHRLAGPQTVSLEIVRDWETWQARLDTPPSAIPFQPTGPGLLDTPRHRWQIRQEKA
jgi:hypothetical protein